MRVIHRLSHAKLRSLPDGTHGDGGGLYLRVEGDKRYWLFRYVRNKQDKRAQADRPPSRLTSRVDRLLLELADGEKV